MLYLRELRKQKELTLQQVCTDLNISTSLLSKLENGLICMSPKYKELLETYYGTSFKVPISDISLLQIIKEYNPKIRTSEDACKLLEHILVDYESLKTYVKINIKTINNLNSKLNKINEIINKEE